MMKALVVLRCGRQSLHPAWLEGPGSDWDLVLCPHQEIEPSPTPTFLYPGQKWMGLQRFFSETSDWKAYDYIWLPDDDLLTNRKSISGFFSRCHEHAAMLAAPALSEDSFFSHPMTMLNTRFQYRKTTFLEIMAPCFHNGFLREAIATFDLSKSGTGFGLEYLWAEMLKYSGMFIFDDVPVKHTRPVGGFRDAELGARAMGDLGLILNGIGARGSQQTLGGRTRDGRWLAAGDRGFLPEYLFGYEYLIERHPQAIWQLLHHQAQEEPAPRDLDFRRFVEFGTRHAAVAGRSLAIGRPALVSSVSEYSASQDPAVEAAGANDGIIDGQCGFHTAFETDPWWQVDLQHEAAIQFIDIYNRLDLKERCTRLAVLISFDGERWTLVASKLTATTFGGADGSPHSFSFDPPIPARFVRVQMLGKGFFHLDQVEIFAECPQRETADLAA